MHYLVALLFRGPFWVQLLIAAALVWGGVSLAQHDAARLAARTALIEATPPATVPVAKAETKGKTGEVEVSVLAQVATDHNTQLVKRTNGLTTAKSLMYVLVDADAAEGNAVARAAILIKPGEQDAFVNWLIERSEGFGPLGPVVRIDGLTASPSQSGQATEALKEQKLEKSPDFFFIEPFVEGRAATLAHLPAGTGGADLILYGFAALFGLIALKKFTRRGKAAKAAPSPAPAPDLARTPDPRPSAPSDPKPAATKARDWRRVALPVVLVALITAFFVPGLGSVILTVALMGVIIALRLKSLRALFRRAETPVAAPQPTKDTAITRVPTLGERLARGGDNRVQKLAGLAMVVAIVAAPALIDRKTAEAWGVGGFFGVGPMHSQNPVPKGLAQANPDARPTPILEVQMTPVSDVVTPAPVPQTPAPQTQTVQTPAPQLPAVRAEAPRAAAPARPAGLREVHPPLTVAPTPQPVAARSQTFVPKMPALPLILLIFGAAICTATLAIAWRMLRTKAIRAALAAEERMFQRIAAERRRFG